MLRYSAPAEDLNTTCCLLHITTRSPCFSSPFYLRHPLISTTCVCISCPSLMLITEHNLAITNPLSYDAPPHPSPQYTCNFHHSHRQHHPIPIRNTPSFFRLQQNITSNPFFVAAAARLLLAGAVVLIGWLGFDRVRRVDSAFQSWVICYCCVCSRLIAKSCLRTAEFYCHFFYLVLFLLDFYWCSFCWLKLLRAVGNVV